MRNGHPPTNPFTYGALALDDAFTNRETELRDLVADMENGQDVVLYAPRRYGKSSLVIRASQRALKRDVLVGYCDLMRTTTKERFAAALAKTIYADSSRRASRSSSARRASSAGCGSGRRWRSTPTT